MRRNLQTKRGREFRKSLLRGLEKGNREWLRICTGHNLLKLFRSGAPRDAKRAASQPRMPTSSVAMRMARTQMQDSGSS